MVDGIGELVHNPLVGSSGGVLQRRQPTWVQPSGSVPRAGAVTL